MTVQLKRAGAGASEDDLRHIEQVIGFPISRTFADFVRAHNGAVPETNTFNIAQGNQSGVNRFIPVSDILAERQRLEPIPRGAYPVAWAEGGNYVFINEEEGGKVYFWDHEVADGTHFLADTFDAFLANLTPFDVRSVSLAPGQVKRAWINKDFLKRIKK